MKGIITTNDPMLVEPLSREFGAWRVFVSGNSKLIEFYPIPSTY